MQITADILLSAYVGGIFPMGSEEGINWYAPELRAIIPFENYHASKSLRPILNKGTFSIVINQDFEGVIKACSAPRDMDDGVWITDEIIDLYTQLHERGFAHSVEAYYEGELAGGLYGIAIGGAFFGESMFYKVSNSSKVAFHYLIEILKYRGFALLDSQFINDNVLRYGAIEIPKRKYEKLLAKAIKVPTSFIPRLGPITLEELLQS